MKFDPAFLWSVTPVILTGLWTTLWIAVLSSIGATVLGFIFELLRRSNRVMGFVMRGLIDVIRSTPVLVQLYFLFFVLPSVGITLPAVVAGVLGLSLLPCRRHPGQHRGGPGHAGAAHARGHPVPAAGGG